MQRLCDYIAQFLVNKGVKDIFMLTGYGAMYMNDAIEVSGIKYYATRNEATAPMMAEAYARVTQRLGAVCVTAGPGATNAIPGLAEAYVDSAPILVLSGQVDSAHTTHAAKLPGLRSFGTAEINIVPIVKPLTKYAAVIDDPQRVRYHLEKAYYLATSGRPGPVWLDVPLDIQQAMIDPQTLEGFTPEQEKNSTELEQKVDQFIELLLKSERPLIVGGHGIRQGKAIDEFKKLIDHLNAPVVFSRLGQDILGHSHPNIFGQAGIKGSKYCKEILNNTDCILSLGCRLAPQFAGHQFDAFDKEAKVVMVDIEEDELKKPGVPLDLPIHADVKEFLSLLVNKLSKQTLPNWQPWLQRCNTAKESRPMITKEMHKDPIDLYYFMSRLDALSDKQHILVTDAGSNYYVGGQVYNFNKGQREITSGTNAAMGTTIPLAIGASIAAPDSQVLAVTGDGSLELNIQELKTISHYKLNIKLFVINNGGYASMRKWQDTFFDGRRIDTEESTGAGTLDLRKVADAFDLNYACIDKCDDIDDQLREIMKSDQPLYVEVMTDYNQKIFDAFADFKEELINQE